MRLEDLSTEQLRALLRAVAEEVLPGQLESPYGRLELCLFAAAQALLPDAQIRTAETEGTFVSQDGKTRTQVHGNAYALVWKGEQFNTDRELDDEGLGLVLLSRLRQDASQYADRTASFIDPWCMPVRNPPRVKMLDRRCEEAILALFQSRHLQAATEAAQGTPLPRRF